MAVAVKARSRTDTHEEVLAVTGARSGAPMVVAIHSTALGPALGGLRIWSYDDPAEAEADARRLAEGMTLKAAAAGLELGGGKGVICAPADGFELAERREALLDFGDLVESLGGRYITAEDVGVTPADLAVVAERTGHLTGLPPERGGSGDPSPVTAIGVESAMRACARERFGSADLRNLRVVVIGLGHVGLALAELLASDGCTLAVSDVVDGKRADADRIGAAWIEADEALATRCDVLAPCALGGVINPETAAELRCGVVCGSANNQLADDSLAESLAERAILYAPDFIANAGGLINVYREIRGYDERRAVDLACGIESTMNSILEVAAARRTTPLAAARALAAERLGAALPD
jgi:leucine dehydrogenase